MGQLKAIKADDQFDPRVSLAPERVLVDLDYRVLLSLLKDSPDKLRQGLEELERMIRKSGAVSYLDRLCAANCDRRALLWLLHPFVPEPVFKIARWSSKRGAGPADVFLGITSKERKKLINKLSEVATQVEIVNAQPQFGSLLMLSRSLYPTSRLPRTLRTYAKLLRYAARYFAGNSHIYDSVAKARLTTYVQTGIGRSDLVPKMRSRQFHDEEIAGLISSVSNDQDCRYDGTAHRMWRRKHYHRLNMLDPDVKIHGLFTASNIALASLSNS
jgi:hypothetical protein